MSIQPSAFKAFTPPVSPKLTPKQALKSPSLNPTKSPEESEIATRILETTPSPLLLQPTSCPPLFSASVTPPTATPKRPNTLSPAVISLQAARFIIVTPRPKELEKAQQAAQLFLLRDNLSYQDLEAFGRRTRELFLSKMHEWTEHSAERKFHFIDHFAQTTLKMLEQIDTPHILRKKMLTTLVALITTYDAFSPYHNSCHTLEIARHALILVKDMSGKGGLPVNFEELVYYTALHHQLCRVLKDSKDKCQLVKGSLAHESQGASMQIALEELAPDARQLVKDLLLATIQKSPQTSTEASFEEQARHVLTTWPLVLARIAARLYETTTASTQKADGRFYELYPQDAQQLINLAQQQWRTRLTTAQAKPVQKYIETLQNQKNEIKAFRKVIKSCHLNLKTIIDNLSCDSSLYSPLSAFIKNIERHFFVEKSGKIVGTCALKRLERRCYMIPSAKKHYSPLPFEVSNPMREAAYLWQATVCELLKKLPSEEELVIFKQKAKNPCTKTSD